MISHQNCVGSIRVTGGSVTVRECGFPNDGIGHDRSVEEISDLDVKIALNLKLIEEVLKLHHLPISTTMERYPGLE
jgi:hypothetical protein